MVYLIILFSCFLAQGWKLVKPLLSKQIQDMVGILDSSKTQGALLKIADAEVTSIYITC